MKKRTISMMAMVTTASILMTGCSGTQLEEMASLLSNFSSAKTDTGNFDSKSVIDTTEQYVECTDTGMYDCDNIFIEPAEVMYCTEYCTEEVGFAGIQASFHTEEYKSLEENGFRSVFRSPLSTFGADVDTASYANLRRMLDYGYHKDEIPSGAVRAEEIINYFSYDYNGPEDGEPFGINAEISNCPWNSNNKLLRIGLQTEKVDFSDAADSNIVFLIDVSGSMEDYDKLPLLKEAFKMLVDELGEKDRVSIVTYAGYDEIVLEGVSGDHKDQIVRALEDLEADGSTNGGQGIISAYELAQEYFIEGGNNRVILATDGDLNVGLTSESELVDLISKEKETGIYLSVLGFGTGNYSDTNLEALADKGNGNYAYIDSTREAKKVLVEELGATLMTVAKDTKLQIEFNPAYVSEYRQIGYENRAMAAEDFEDDKKDGGEIGAGHSVTVLYEIVPAQNLEETNDVNKDEKTNANNELNDGTNNAGAYRYQKSEITENAKESGEWLTLSVRYKEPEADVSKCLEYQIGEEVYTENPSSDFVFQAAAAEFAMYLTDSEYLADGSLRHVKTILNEQEWDDEYKEEFVDLVYMLR